MQTPGLHPFPDLTQPEVAFPLFHQADIDPTMVTHMEDIYLRNLDMPELIEKARLAVVGHASKLLQADPDREISYIVLDLPCTFFMLRSLRWGHSACPLHVCICWRHWFYYFFTLRSLGDIPHRGCLRAVMTCCFPSCCGATADFLPALAGRHFLLAPLNDTAADVVCAVA